MRSQCVRIGHPGSGARCCSSSPTAGSTRHARQATGAAYPSRSRQGAACSNSSRLSETPETRKRQPGSLGLSAGHDPGVRRAGEDHSMPKSGRVARRRWLLQTADDDAARDARSLDAELVTLGVPARLCAGVTISRQHHLVAGVLELSELGIFERSCHWCLLLDVELRRDALAAGVWVPGGHSALTQISRLGDFSHVSMYPVGVGESENL